MNSSESSKSESKPSFPAGGAEHESSPKGFRVEVKDPEEIYEQIKTPAHQWTLGKAPLEKPFEDIQIMIHSDGKKFEVKSWISIKAWGGPRSIYLS